MKNNIEEKAAAFLESEYGASTNEAPMSAHCFIGGYQACTEDVVKVIEAEIVRVKGHRKQPGLTLNEYVKGSYTEIILTDLLTQLNSKK